MKSVFVVLSVLVAIACAHTLRPCGRYGNSSYVLDYPHAWESLSGPRESYSSVYPDASRCSGSKYRLCILSNANSITYDKDDFRTHEYSCAECRTTCDCPSGYYCSNSDSESKDFGKCLSYKHKIGSFCDIGLGTPESLRISTNSTSKNADPYFFNSLRIAATLSDRVCAIFHRHREIGTTYEDYDVFNIEWMGACIFNRCYACNSYYRNYKNRKPYSYDMPTPAPSTSSFSSTVCSTPDAFSSPDATKYKQPSRHCYHDKIVSGPERL